MKKILILSSGKIGAHFIERVISTYSTENIYYVVHDEEKEYQGINPKKFKFYSFDTTSHYKLANLLKMDFVEIIMVKDSPLDIENTLKIIRAVKSSIRVVVLDNFSLDLTKYGVIAINSNELLASRLIDYLPNVPVIAQNVGLGQGEIMEVLVPFGSSYVYRHIGAIEQRQWKIVAIYRNRKLIMPTPTKMIQPNDLLLIVGGPSVLQSVYRSIKRELGQFPEPFGTTLYLLIDMARQKTSCIKRIVSKAMKIHARFKHQLVIKVVNATDIDMLQTIKSYRSEEVFVDICFDKTPLRDIVLSDIRKYHVGLVLISRALFARHAYRQILFDGKVPIFKLAEKNVSKLKKAVVILSENNDLERISTTIFDISVQMRVNLELYNYLGENQEVKKQVGENFNNLSTIFSKSIKIHEIKANPIRELSKEKNFLHCMPYSKKMVERTVVSLFSTDSDRLYYKLDEFHQIFIPVQI